MTVVVGAAAWKIISTRGHDKGWALEIRHRRCPPRYWLRAEQWLAGVQVPWP